jgi:cephalosporin hydroxylase
VTEIDPEVVTPEDEKVIWDFNKLYQRMPKRTWMSTTWRGVQVAKPPTDLWMYQEIIFENKPELIIETGTFAGGSARFFADLMYPWSGQVVTVDTTAMGWAKTKNHPAVEFLVGSSLDPEIISRIRHLARAAKSVMVVLDSLHTKDHVLQEMKTYGPLVTPGQYMVVEDTVTIGEPVQAIEEFLRINPEFEVDGACDKFLLSFSSGGFLKRVK